jgi:lipoprotein
MNTTLSKTIRISLILAACLFVFSSCIRKKADYGKVVVKNIPVEKFHELEVPASVPVHIIQGKECCIKVKGPEGLLSFVNFHVVEGKLVIQMKELDSAFGIPFYSFKTDKLTSRVEVYVTAPTFTQMTLYGASPIFFPDSITLDKLNITSPGASNININKMMINQLNISIEGVSDVNIKNLTAKQANFDISGNSDIKMNSGHVDNTSFSIAGNADLKIRNLTAKKARFAVPGNARLDVNFNRTDTASFYIMGNADAKVTGTTRQPIQTITEGKAVIKDETTRIK